MGNSNLPGAPPAPTKNKCEALIEREREITNARKREGKEIPRQRQIYRGKMTDTGIQKIKELWTQRQRDTDIEIGRQIQGESQRSIEKETDRE